MNDAIATAAITRPEPHTHGADADDCQLCKLTNISTLKSRLITAREFAAQAESAYSEKYKALVEVLEATRNAWEAQNALIVAERDRTAAYLEATEKDLRQAVIDWCREHDTKKFDEHLSMRVIVKLEYEPDQATTWAKTNAPFILVADRKQFDALAKKQDFDFVNKVPSYSAVIASDLTTSNQQG